jgi:7-cyano-7-deazaguanine synthase
MKRKMATVLFSGGIDSTACIRFFLDREYEVRAIFVNFGQAAAPAESRAVELLKERLEVPVTTIQVAPVSSFGTGELQGRNAFLIFAAILMGGCHDGLLAIGIHAGTPYYDCSPPFIETVNTLVKECTNGHVSVAAPFVRWSKDDVYSFFSNLNLPLSFTYSCEAGAMPPCGQCASCKDRVRFECSRSVAI